MTDRVVRVCVTGVESSGKSALAHALAERLDTVVVPELLRALNTVKLARGEATWTEDDLLDIIHRRRRLEEELADRARGVLVLDGDALSIAVLHEQTLGRRSSRIADAAASHPADLYILAGDEIPFVPGELRDHAFGAFRPLAHLRFVQALEQSGAPWVLARGTVEQRLEITLQFLSAHGVTVAGLASSRG